MRWRRVVLAAAALLLGGCGEGANARLALPGPTSVSEPAVIRISGLDAGRQVSVTARWRAPDGRLWSGSRPVRADARGRARLGMDLLAFLRPSRPGSPFMLPALGRNRIDIAIRNGGGVLAKGVLVRDAKPAAVDVRELTVARDGIAGAYFAPARTRGSAVMLLGGSEGGSASHRPTAAQLAALGHPALVLAYFGAPGLPGRLSHIQVETVFRGMRWLRDQHGARSGSAAILGTSRGAELALISASLKPSLAHAVIALVPTAYVFTAQDGGPAWTYRRRPFPEGTAIDVERIRGKVLVAGAGQDALWSSAHFADDIAKTIREHGKARVERLNYPDAGHGIGVPLPFIPLMATERLGGTTRADAAARQDLWPRIVRLLASG